jgi:hypothetical protein
MKARVTQEIFYKGKTYVPGELIEVDKESIYTLQRAGVIGQEEVETAMQKPKENAMKQPVRGR